MYTRVCMHTCTCTTHTQTFVFCFNYNTTDGNRHPSTWGRDANTNREAAAPSKLNTCKICPLISICSCCHPKGLSLSARTSLP